MTELLDALRDYFRAVDDIRDAGEARMGDPGKIQAMYRDAGKRMADAERILRAALRDAEPRHWTQQTGPNHSPFDCNECLANYKQMKKAKEQG